jgi:ribosomal protein L11 methyltransferase
MLDFGAGNGILGIAGAMRGAKVECVEIDENALNEARRNAEINDLYGLFDFRTILSTTGTRFEVIAANILVAVLIAFVDELTTRLTPNGHLILSGLTSTDVPSILINYRRRLPQHNANIFERGAWRVVIFSPKR